MTEQTRLIRASSDLLEMFGSMTGDGRTLTAEWGEPIGYCLDSGEWIYEPRFRASGSTEAERDAVSRADAILAAQADVLDALEEAVRAIEAPNRFVAADNYEQGIAESAVLEAIQRQRRQP